MTAAGQREGWVEPPPAPGAVQLSQSGLQPGQWPVNWVESGWKLGIALFLAVALLVRTPEEPYEEHTSGKQKQELMWWHTPVIPATQEAETGGSKV